MPETEVTPDRRKVLEEAWAVEEAKDTLEGAPDETQEETPPQTPTEEKPPEEPQEPAEGETQRDEKGRFVPGRKEGVPADATKTDADQRRDGAAEQKQRAIQPSQTPQGPVLRPPASWRPLAREHWEKLPEQVKQEAIRLEVDARRNAQESAMSRQIADAYQRTVAPFEPMFRQFGVEPMQGLQFLARTYQELQFAPVPRRIGILADLIKQTIGVDQTSMQALADALDGGAPGNGARAAQSFDPNLIANQVTQQVLQSFEGRAQQYAFQNSSAEVQAFESQGPEFLEQVRDRMSYILDSDAAWKQTLPEGDPRKIALTLEDAYNMACQMDDEVSQVLQQRQEVEAATARNAATQRARVAAGSIRSEGGGVESPDDSRLGVLRRAWEREESR